jgi:hypothetical protein
MTRALKTSGGEASKSESLSIRVGTYLAFFDIGSSLQDQRAVASATLVAKLAFAPTLADELAGAFAADDVGIGLAAGDVGVALPLVAGEVALLSAPSCRTICVVVARQRPSMSSSPSWMLLRGKCCIHTLLMPRYHSRRMCRFMVLEISACVSANSFLSLSVRSFAFGFQRPSCNKINSAFTCESTNIRRK